MSDGVFQIQQTYDPYFPIATQTDSELFMLSVKSTVLRERLSSELLPYAEEVVRQLQEKTDLIKEKVHGGEEGIYPNFTKSLLALEYERLRYVLCSYLRERVLKIEMCPEFILGGEYVDFKALLFCFAGDRVFLGTERRSSNQERVTGVRANWDHTRPRACSLLECLRRVRVPYPIRPQPSFFRHKYS